MTSRVTHAHSQAEGIGLTAVMAAILAIVAALAFAAPAAIPSSCVRSGERVLAESDRLQVTAAAVARGEYDEAFGCVRKTGRRVLLDEDDENDSILRPIRLSGYWVAYVKQSFLPTGENQAELLVRDLRTDGAGDAIFLTPCGPCRRYTSLVLRPRGSVAWIVGAGTEDDPYEVYKCEVASCIMAQGEPTRLDHGRTIAPRSLTREGQRIYWIKGQRRKSAVLG